MKKKDKKERIWQLINPKYLQQQADGYGYYFSMRNYLFLLTVSMAGVMLCGSIFALRWYFTGAVIIVWTLFLPGMLLDGYKNMYEHKKFLEVSDYMEQLLYSFKQQGKILTALRDTGELFQEGRMRKCIGQAVDYIEKGVYEKDLYREAFSEIERVYPGRRIAGIHNFLRLVEKNGGNYSNGITLLLEDKALWEDNVLLLQEDKRRGRNRVSAALIITMVLAAVFHGVYRSMPKAYSIVDNPITQIATTCYILLNILIFRKANRELAESWLKRESTSEERKVRDYWKVVTDYGSRPLWRKNPVAYRISYNWLVKEINLRFPQWLMEIALLLQGNNVQVAITKTLTDAPAVLRPELEKLIEGLKKQPEAMKPYMEFLKQFQLSYVQSAMKMLYAISESGQGDSQEQIKLMVRRNEKLMDKAEKILNERNLTGISMVGYLPQITISFQMMANMVVFMMVFLAQMRI